MASGFEKLTAIAGNGEGVGFEFKQFLTRETHLKGERRQTLACQMKYKLLQADGKTQYIVGITDSGYLKGISRPQLDESVHVLHAIARDVGAHVCGVEEYAVKGGHIGLLTIKNMHSERDHILVGTAGHVDHGKAP